MNHLGTQTLETPRLILRKFNIEDAEAMYRNWASEDIVTRYLTWPTHGSTEITKGFLNFVTEEYDKPDCYNWCIELKSIREPIGSISVVNIQHNVDGAELGYCIGSCWWGQGLMPEAGQAVLRFLFEQVGFQRICALHAAQNPKSGRVMQKLGMKQEGLLRRAGRCNQGIVDMVCYSILKEEWEADRKGAQV